MQMARGRERAVRGRGGFRAVKFESEEGFEQSGFESKEESFEGFEQSGLSQLGYPPRVPCPWRS